MRLSVTSAGKQKQNVSTCVENEDGLVKRRTVKVATSLCFCFSGYSFYCLMLDFPRRQPNVESQISIVTYDFFLGWLRLEQEQWNNLTVHHTWEVFGQICSLQFASMQLIGLCPLIIAGREVGLISYSVWPASHVTYFCAKTLHLFFFLR